MIYFNNVFGYVLFSFLTLRNDFVVEYVYNTPKHDPWSIFLHKNLISIEDELTP